MLLLAVVGGLLLAGGPAEAVRWEFDDGTAQGWSAKEAYLWGGTREYHLFPGAVQEGVWRIAVDPAVTKSHYFAPLVELISPAIGYDSGLFDQVRVRFRTVHSHPTTGYFRMAWTNEHNAALDLEPASAVWPYPLINKADERDATGRFIINPVGVMDYTTQWQEAVIEWAGRDDVLWAGRLEDIRLTFSLDDSIEPELFAIRPRHSTDSPQTVEWLEIDWIELTGAGELAEGELPPPGVEYFRFDGAGLFAPPAFYPLAPGIGEQSEGGSLTDLDGDGDLDLFALYQYQTAEEGWRGYKAGWLIALNDGDGALELAVVEEQISGDFVAVANNRFYGAIDADVTGDGRAELVLYDSNGARVEVWTIGADRRVEVLVQFADKWLEATGDWDGDGRVELFFSQGDGVTMWGLEQGAWASEEVDRAALAAAESVSWLWSSESGDFDGDGQAEHLAEFLYDSLEGRKGLVLQRGRSSESIEAEVLYDARLHLRSGVLVRDLNGDGMDDWAFVGGDRASGFGVFVGWGGNRREERQRLLGSGRHLLDGDLDGDGDLDLVVLDPIWGGVHLLESSLAVQPTAVQAAERARPAQHRLGASYPNPFNPQMAIPLDLATDQAQVSLVIYDVLGRRVRRVWQGPLAAGSHRFVWDGRDEAGRVVAAGMYIYRVEVDGRVQAKKATKLP